MSKLNIYGALVSRCKPQGFEQIVPDGMIDLTSVLSITRIFDSSFVTERIGEIGR